MQHYSHDYTLVQEAMDRLYSATRLHANECYDAVLERINDARSILMQYLSKDNMVPDNDVYNSWVHANEAEEEIDRLKEQNSYYRETIDALSCSTKEIVRRSEYFIRESQKK